MSDLNPDDDQARDILIKSLQEDNSRLQRQVDDLCRRLSRLEMESERFQRTGGGICDQDY
jgi:predicted RNase H-like nuclease (RuvC/YqgF family)